MESNFIAGIFAISYDIRLFMLSLLQNASFIGFAVGFVVTILVVGFIITKNPKHIPLILRYNAMQSFQKVAGRDKNGTYNMAYSDFVRIYTQTRTLFLIAFISFCVMVSTILITQ